MERSAYITTGIHFLLHSPSFPVAYASHSFLMNNIYFYFVNFSAFDRKPFTFSKPLTPPSTPASPFGSSSMATHPVQKRVMPPAQTQTQGPPLLPGPNHSSTSPHQRAQTPLHSQSPPFVVPCTSVNHPDASYSTDHRYVGVALFYHTHLYYQVVSVAKMSYFFGVTMINF